MSGKRLMAVASSGGHWMQLRRLAAAFDGCETHYVTTEVGHRDEVSGAFTVVRDANADDPLGCFVLLWQSLWLVLRTRPEVVVTTGAAPGVFILIFARLLGARTVWIDSIANGQQLSLSGRLVRPFAGLWLTQWPELARDDGPEFAGAVF